MGEFIGGVGAALMMAVVAALAVKFLLDTGLIKNRENVLLYGRVSVCTVIVGAVYMAVTVFMYNTLKGQTNFFDLETVYKFMGIKKALELCTAPDIGACFGGLMMPLYPLVTHIFGRLVFGQFALTAQFISFVCACFAAGLLYSLLLKATDRGRAQNVMLAAGVFPYAFMLFAPCGVSMLTAFIIAAAYALVNKKTAAFLVFAVLACLTGKLGVVAFLLYPFREDIIKGLAWLSSRRAFGSIGIRVTVTLLALFNGAAMYWLIR